MRDEFVKAIEENKGTFGIDLDAGAVGRLADHYELVQENNPLMHLVGPASAEEFAVRHVLESLTMLEFLPAGSRLADIGSGAGLPAIPCLIVRENLSAYLIESKERKSAFLTEAADRLGLGERATVVNKQFAEFPCPGDVSAVCCRALDKFTSLVPKLLKWSGRRRKLFFGGPSLRDALSAGRCEFSEKLMPQSEQRYLFIIE